MSPRYQCDQYIQMKIDRVQDIIAKKRKIKDVAEFFSVSRQIVSRWVAIYRVHGEKWLVPKKPWPKNGTAWNRTDTLIEERVCILAKQFPHLGTEDLASKLEEITGITRDQSTIYRILRRNKTRYTRRGDWKERSKKLYVLDRPGREIQVDACFPFGYSRRETQYDGLDDCSRFVFSALHSEHSVRSSMEFVWNLIHASPFHIEKIRTDDGREFWPGFTKFLESLNIIHIKNPPYTPEHNGKVERYHRTLWKCIWEYSVWISVDEYRYRLKLFTDWYNYKKPHRGLGMFGMTPAEKIGYCLLQKILQTQKESEEPSGERVLKNVNLILQNNNFRVFDLVFQKVDQPEKPRERLLFALLFYSFGQKP
jgi:transposase InsO family protein